CSVTDSATARARSRSRQGRRRDGGGGLANGCVAELCEGILGEGLRLLRRNGDLDGLPFNGRFEDAEHDRKAVERELARAAVRPSCQDRGRHVSKADRTV